MQAPKILVVCAAQLEAKELIKLPTEQLSNNTFKIEYKTLSFDLLITGVGIAAMTYHLTTHLMKNNYDFVVLMGISGAYSTTLQLGEVVQVETERFGDLGVLLENGFLDLFDTQLADSNVFPFKNKVLKNYTLINNQSVLKLATAQGNTVQTIRPKINAYIQQQTDVESMEGAAFFYVCMQQRIPFLQIRSISNYVGEQNKQLWNIPLAITKLTNAVFGMFDEFLN